MFDIGWTEIVIIIIVSCLVLDLKDVPKIIKELKRFIKHCNDFIAEIKQVFTDLEQETNKIIDLDGNEQITYDLSDIMPDLKKDKNLDEVKKSKNK